MDLMVERLKDRISLVDGKLKDIKSNLISNLKESTPVDQLNQSLAKLEESTQNSLTERFKIAMAKVDRCHPRPFVVRRQGSYRPNHHIKSVDFSLDNTQVSSYSYSPHSSPASSVFSQKSILKNNRNYHHNYSSQQKYSNQRPLYSQYNYQHHQTRPNQNFNQEHISRRHQTSSRLSQPSQQPQRSKNIANIPFNPYYNSNFQNNAYSTSNH